jgi:CBS domain-containing protein
MVAARSPGKKPLEEVFRGEKAGRIGLREPITVSPQTTLGETLERLRAAPGACVVVVERWGDRLKPAGIFTQRDYLTKLAGRPIDEGLESLPIERFMTPRPATLFREETLGAAIQRLTKGGYRHLPLVDAEGNLTGVLSVEDIIVFLAELFPTDCINLPPRLHQHHGIDSREGG